MSSIETLIDYSSPVQQSEFFEDSVSENYVELTSLESQDHLIANISYLAWDFSAPTTQYAVGCEAVLREIEALKANWDGYGARAVRREVVDNARQLLWSFPSNVVVPDITPNPNGTLSLEWESDFGYALLEVGLTRLSFYAKPDDGVIERFDGEIAALPPTLGSTLGSIVMSAVYPLAQVVAPVTHVAPASFDA